MLRSKTMARLSRSDWGSAARASIVWGGGCQQQMFVTASAPRSLRAPSAPAQAQLPALPPLSSPIHPYGSREELHVSAPVGERATRTQHPLVPPSSRQLPGQLLLYLPFGTFQVSPVTVVETGVETGGSCSSALWPWCPNLPWREHQKTHSCLSVGPSGAVGVRTHCPNSN